MPGSRARKERTIGKFLFPENGGISPARQAVLFASAREDLFSDEHSAKEKTHETEL